MQNINISEVIELIKEVWGLFGKDAPQTKERRATITNKISGAVKHTLALAPDSLKQQSSLNLLFPIGKVNISSNGNKPIMRHRLSICEEAYLKVIDLNATNMWLDIKKLAIKHSGDIEAMQEDSEMRKQINSTKASSEKTNYQPQREIARDFIIRYGDRYGDSSVDAGEANDNVKILPVYSQAELYREYTNHCATIRDGNVVSSSTFRNAWNELKKEGAIKCLRSRGTFHTCDICNNANELLLGNFKAHQKEIIKKYKQVHLIQQAAERSSLNARKQEAILSREEDNPHQPSHCLIFGDGMTKYAGRTPKYGQSNSKKDMHFYEDRVFGVEVYCGPIVGEILIHTDDLVRGGANFTIEVQRRDLIELGKLLKVTNWFNIINSYDHYYHYKCFQNRKKI
jgi:hypothetical protein